MYLLLKECSHPQKYALIIIYANYVYFTLLHTLVDLHKYIYIISNNIVT